VSPRLHVVTGKGGTGKTTVAASLAIALASRPGGRVLLIEVEERQGIAQLFDTAPLPYEERKVAGAPGGGEVIALAVDARDALLDYLELFYNLRRAGGILERLGAIDFATTIAPGLRDVLLIGKVKEAVVRADPHRPGGKAFDAVVLDAPPTGRIGRFLNVTHHVSGLAKMGPIRTQSDGVTNLLRSPQTVVHLVTLLEEMPVQETLDAATELAGLGIAVGHVIVDMAREPLLSDAQRDAAAQGKVGRSTLRKGLLAAGVSADEALLDSLTAEVVDHALRLALEDRERKVLAELGHPVVELPLLPQRIDLAGLLQLAELLGDVA
jgi:anion-transporting  ArsA/GET3 family ATPase